jgi:hypothetical protein
MRLVCFDEVGRISARLFARLAATATAAPVVTFRGESGVIAPAWQFHEREPGRKVRRGKGERRRTPRW